MIADHGDPKELHQECHRELKARHNGRVDHLVHLGLQVREKDPTFLTEVLVWHGEEACDPHIVLRT